MLSSELMDLVNNAKDLKWFTVNFTLWPALWVNFKDLTSLQWSAIDFLSGSSQLPSDMSGIYAFVVEPNVGGLPGNSIVYVGETTRQSLAKRYSDYVGDLRRKKPRPHIAAMLGRWSPPHLKFYYAPMSDKSLIKSVEAELIRALLPPFNISVPADISATVRAAF